MLLALAVVAVVVYAIVVLFALAICRAASSADRAADRVEGAQLDLSPSAPAHRAMTEAERQKTERFHPRAKLAVR